MEINPRSYVPVYQQLADILREKIHSGELQPGTVLPGEHDLARQYEISRPAVRQALGVLRAEALIVTLRGESTRVRHQPERQPLVIDATTRVWFRQPTPAERVELRIDEGVGLAVIETEGEPPRTLPADEVFITGR
ncbi:GntR family transcriptional regulator [Sphaerimonospora thailandensis]|uniref:GntR family transcriptional regulator n=1 Tax=Sphaerimonospora thailandensis TaxID=795644 RepID=UPI001950DB1B|nr:GntR family transcriptional regulator [Sphaerimonospora thailandensis]